MNAPVHPPVPPYKHTPLFPLGKDKTQYRTLEAPGIRVETAFGKDFVVVPRSAMKILAEEAFNDINHLSSSKPSAEPARDPRRRGGER